MSHLRLKPTITKFRMMFEGAELRQVFLVLFVAALDGLFQALGVASIMPFIAILANPDLVETNRFLLMFRGLLPVGLQDQMIWVTGLLALAVLIISNTLTVLDYWLSLRLFNGQRHRLSTQLLSLYLGKSLLAFSSRKITDMSTTILSEVERVVIGTLMAAVGMLADIIVVVAIVSLLMYVNFGATVVVLLILTIGYLLVHYFTVHEIERLGESHARAEAEMFSTLSQALALFKEGKIAGKGAYFRDRFARPAREVTRITDRYEILTFVPAQLIEVLTFGAMVVVALYLADNAEQDFTAITVIAFYAFAAYRIVPVLKSLLDSFEAFRYGATVVDKVVSELGEEPEDDLSMVPPVARLPLNEAIELEQLGFRYPDAPVAVFEGLNARIPAGVLTCLVGPSGAGKSTLLDILLGLMVPSHGRCLIDGVPLDSRTRRAWQRGVGYVPQQVQLLDASVAENIALGEIEIDRDKVVAAAKAAGLHRLASEELANGYETLIGDGGHQLSSGERQRVGIARALYRDPEVLLLDEATNELDAETEASVLRHLLKISGKTIIFATHKSSIWDMADTIVRLEGRF